MGREKLLLYIASAPKFTWRWRDLDLWQSLKIIKEEKEAHFVVEGEASRADHINKTLLQGLISRIILK